MTSTLFPLTAPATSIFLGQEVLPDNPCYNTAEVIELPEDSDLDALRMALRQVYEENEQLRVEVVRQDGGVLQGVIPIEDFCQRVGLFPEISETAIQNIGTSGYLLPPEVATWALSLQQKPFDLYKGETVRSAAFRFAGKLWLFHSFHHLVADGFAAFSALSQLVQKYRAMVSGKDPETRMRLSLADLLASDERANMNRADETADYLAHQQKGNPEFLALTDTTIAGRTAPASSFTHRHVFGVSVESQALLLEVAEKYEVSWPVVLTTLTGQFLNRISGNLTGSFAVPQMNRMVQGRGADWGRSASQTACTAVSMLPVRVGSEKDVAVLLKNTAEQIATNQRFSLARTEDLERLAGLEGGRLFGAQINVVPFDSILKLGEEPAKIHNINAGPVTDMTVCFRGRAGGGQAMVCEFETNPALYTDAETQRTTARFELWLRRWLEAVSQDQPVAELSLCTPDDVVQLQSYNSTSQELEYENLLSRFRSQVAKTPDATALIASEVYDSSAAGAYDFSRVLTYSQLDQQAQETAKKLIKLGVQPGDAVGLRVDRSIEQYVLLYALLYVGAIYVPFLPELPADRVRSMIEDSSCVALLESPGVEQLEDGIDIPVYSWDNLSAVSADEISVENFPGLLTQVDETAYILFTSGSTGRPKGVPISHAALDNRLLWQQSVIPVFVGKRVLHKTPISFDVHVWELYWPLAQGATVVIAAPNGQRDPAYLARVIVEQQVTCLHFVPTMFTAFLASAEAREILTGDLSLESVVCSGEALTLEQVELSREVLGVSPLNLYGPTEAAIDVTYFDTAQLGDRNIVPIGFPVWNTQCAIFDTEGKVAPPGVVGELVLMGVQLARGYQNNPEATEKAFGEDTVTGEPFYRTGDLALWGDDDALYYRGRRDHQVKIRGQRLELGEIEAVLASHPAVHNAVCGIRSDAGEPALAAYLESAAPREELIDSARSLCEERLPDYMVPSFWFVLSEFPVGSSGKADRKLLNTLELVNATGESRPESYREQVLCEIFAEVTGLSLYGVDEDFFRNGGSSLSALQLISLIEQRLGARLSIAAVFSYPTPRLLARNYSENTGGELSPVLPLRKVQNSEKTLLFLPPAGGLSWCYSSFLAHIPADVSVYALQAPQIENLEADFPHTIAEAAAAYAERIQELGLQQVYVVGWSVGGTLAPEVAKVLVEQGTEVENVAVLDGYPVSNWADVAAPDEVESYRAILRMGAVPEPAEVLTLERTVELLQESGSALGQLDGAVLSRCIESMRASTNMMRASEQSFYEGRVEVFAVEHPDQPYLISQDWESFAREVNVHSLQGEHIDLVKGENPSLILSKLLD